MLRLQESEKGSDPTVVPTDSYSETTQENIPPELKKKSICRKEYI